MKSTKQAPTRDSSVVHALLSLDFDVREFSEQLGGFDAKERAQLAAVPQRRGTGRGELAPGRNGSLGRARLHSIAANTHLNG